MKFKSDAQRKAVMANMNNGTSRSTPSSGVGQVMSKSPEYSQTYAGQKYTILTQSDRPFMRGFDSDKPFKVLISDGSTEFEEDFRTRQEARNFIDSQPQKTIDYLNKYDSYLQIRSIDGKIADVSLKPNISDSTFEKDNPKTSRKELLYHLDRVRYDKNIRQKYQKAQDTQSRNDLLDSRREIESRPKVKTPKIKGTIGFKPNNTKLTQAQQKRLTTKQQVDPQAKRELQLYIQSTQELYKEYEVPITKNLEKKKAKGTYDSDLATLGYLKVAEAGARKYQKEFGSGSQIFTKADKIAVAKSIRREFEIEYESGNRML